MKRFKEAQEYLKHDYLKREGFTGVFYGYKYVNGQRTPEICLSFHVKEKLPSSQVKKKDRIPKKMDGFTTDVIQSDIKPCAIVPYSGDYYMETLRPGISVGPEIMRKSGTWGCIAYDLDNDNAQGILSNHHVLWDTGIESNPYIMQPGRGNPYDDRIAELSPDKFYLGIRGDFAFASLLDYRGIDEHMYGTNVLLNAARDPILGEIVKKTGRTTGVTSGIVVGFGTFQSDYTTVYTNSPYGVVTIDGVQVDPLTNPLEMIMTRGDSGSGWYVDGTTTIVGILCGGAGYNFDGSPSGDPVHAYLGYITNALTDLNLSMLPESSAWIDPTDGVTSITLFPNWVAGDEPQYFSVSLVPQDDLDNLSIFTESRFIDSIDGGIVWVKRSTDNIYKTVGVNSTSPSCNLGNVVKNVPVTLDIMILNSNNLSLAGEYAIPLFIGHGDLDNSVLYSGDRFRRSSGADTFFYASDPESASWLMNSDEAS